jgi:hypothetical protein
MFGMSIGWIAACLCRSSAIHELEMDVASLWGYIGELEGALDGKEVG